MFFPEKSPLFALFFHDPLGDVAEPEPGSAPRIAHTHSELMALQEANFLSLRPRSGHPLFCRRCNLFLRDIFQYPGDSQKPVFCL